MMIRRKLSVYGVVQGVGFRPFVHRLARRHGLTGFVGNDPSGVFLEVQGPPAEVDAFTAAIAHEAPPLAVVRRVEVEELPVAAEENFVIATSTGTGGNTEVSPDWDVCPACLAELFDPKDRRYRYPFINCTDCGPRYSIITSLPYDRPATTMAPFDMCPACAAEYHDPDSRRFHAQPNACAECGPQLRLVDATGSVLPGDAPAETLRLLREGNIVAIKGTGGYHLAADPANDAAVGELRRRKRRDEKPFALLCRNVEQARTLAHVDETEASFLQSPERPIVLLKKRDDNALSPLVAPLNGYFGIMLPSTPLQHLLMERDAPLIMTSGNLSDEPIAFRDEDAVARLSGIADAYLLHDRAIRTRLDDSVIRLFRGEPVFLRRSRGYAPRAVTIPDQPAVLAVGAELKSALCITRGDRAFVSQHIGDLKNPETLESLAEASAHLQGLLGVQPVAVAHDLHPDYLSTRHAESLPLPRIAVQHHHAHMVSCMTENGIDGEAIGIIFDGTGYGEEGTVWGGEFLVGDAGGFRRMGHLRPVRMPGGDAAVREPWRMALAYLHSAYGADAFSKNAAGRLTATEKSLFRTMLEKGLNSPFTSSCGRLFDAVAAILGLRETVSYEGQAAMELEALAERATEWEVLPYRLEGTPLILDMLPAVERLAEVSKEPATLAAAARSFHETLGAASRDVCIRLRNLTGLNRVVLSGGVFQNRLLTERLWALLEEENFQVHIHRLLPPNDGGVALGQAVVAGKRLNLEP